MRGAIEPIKIGTIPQCFRCGTSCLRHAVMNMRLELLFHCDFIYILSATASTASQERHSSSYLVSSGRSPRLSDILSTRGSFPPGGRVDSKDSLGLPNLIL